MRCFTCGEDALLEVDGSAGNSVCTRCGTVLEENAIVSEITFGETSGGAAMVQGSYVGADQTRARAPAGYRQKGGGESREQTLLNGRRRIQTLATALRLPDRLADAGQRYFNLAVNMNFVQGRRTQYVVAACLYSACRMEKTSHMLIDFSDLLEINVFVLGSTYLKLIKELSLQLPTVDPSLYISRFAALLEFGDETQKVAQDAVRLVARMGRDWMHIGRRPAGVCGACLLLAARMNNFRRSITEVVQVVKIADVTLRKRLGEFKDTPSGALTVADFRTLWLDETADPPAFSRNQLKEKKEREAAEERRRQKEEGGENSGDDDADDTAAGKEAFAELAAVRGSSPTGSARDSSVTPAPTPVGKRPSARVLGKRKRKDKGEPNDPERVGSEDEEVEEEAPVPEDPYLDEAIALEVGKTLDSEAGKVLTEELDKAQHKRLAIATSMTNLSTSDRLDDLDEEELDMFILTEAEAEAKSRLWMETNKEYLQALADKQTGPDGELRPATQRRARKRHKPRDSNTALGTNAADATKQMLIKKRFSKKINYAAIDSLFGDGPAASTSGSGAGDEGDAPLLGQKHGPEKSGRKRAKGPTVRAGTSIDIPRPTFSSSRAATPVAGRTQSEAPTTPAAGGRARSVSTGPSPLGAQPEKAPAPAPEPDEDHEEDDEEEEEVQQDEEEEDWRSKFGRVQEEEEMDYQEEY